MPDKGIEIQREVSQGMVTLRLKGYMDMNSSPDVREVLTQYLDQKNKAVIVDLSEVPYIDSSGIATLVEGLQWSHNSKHKFRLVGLTPTVKDIFEIARLLQVFEVFSTEDEARQGV
ncbi:MAG: STAS domain-containing protein [Nitrospinaceae bacterium]